MKQETGKKSKLWLWIVLAVVALLAVAAVVVGMMFFNQGEAPATEPVEEKIYSEVYWNLDRVKFTQDSETGLSTREKEADGLYHFRFASQGQLMELATADKQLVNFIDTMNAMGLVFDGDGYVVDAVAVAEIATVVKEEVYVQKANAEMITANSSVVMNGMKTELLI